jgi:hypothetical protein
MLSAVSAAHGQVIFPYVGPSRQPMYESPAPYQPPVVIFTPPPPPVIYQLPYRPLPHPYAHSLPSWVPGSNR